MVTSTPRIVRFSVGVICLSYLASLLWLITWVTLVPSIQGWSATAITTGSMGPHLKAGDVILTARPSEPLRPGDVVLFRNPAGTGNVTHRIIAKDPAGNFVTRGDANPRVDSTPVPPESVSGVGRIVVPAIAKPMVWATTGRWVRFGASIVVTLAAVVGGSWALRGHQRSTSVRPSAPGPRNEPAEPVAVESAPQIRTSTSWLRYDLVAVGAVGVMVAILVTATDSAATFTNSTQNSGSSFTTASSFGLSLGLHNNPTPPTGATSSQQDLPLDTDEPTAPTLFNYDSDRDAFAGLLLAKGSGLSETDSTKFQRWRHNPASALALDGDAALGIWSAMKDFTTGKQGTIVVGLYDCDASGAGCSLITSGTTAMSPWPNNWQLVNVNLGTVNHTIASGRSLVIHLAVTGSSDDDLWFAYDTTTYQSRLTVD